MAYMIADSGCPWLNYNAHVWVVNVALTYYSENRTVYPCCQYAAGNVPNNQESDRTHTLQFQQGH